MNDNVDALSVNKIVIVCDSCDWEHEAQTFDEARTYYDKHCPKCDAKLMTEKDIAMSEQMMGLIEASLQLANIMYPDGVPPEETNASAHIYKDQDTGKYNIDVEIPDGE